MKDIQNQPDYRQISIKKVGVKNIFYPITVLDKEKKTQKTVATVNMYVNLPHHFKGTHMSRFIEILNRFHGEIDLRNFHHILSEMKGKLQAQAAHMEIEFPYFLKKGSLPKMVGSVEYMCKMHGSLEDVDDLVFELHVPISPPNPHQRSEGLPKSLGHWGVAEICLRFKRFIWIEDIIQQVEVITDHDFCWPESGKSDSGKQMTVESITKALGKMLADNSDISWFKVTVKNLSQGCLTFASLEQ